MNIKLYIIPAILATFWIVNSCSPFEETQVKKQEPDSLYIFDEIPPEDSFKFEAPVRESVDVFVVQIGAFSNLESAKDFAEQSRVTLNKDIKVEFNEKKNLYVVWIHPPFQERVAAETFRSELWNYEEFKDAWIVTIESRK
ncbi:MAG TPA: SPOR domain-containing protein [Ignavibacteriaceae bacterium]|nr:SPOR domain-containing protein [Ignavibacteriaceae bacterium]